MSQELIARIEAATGPDRELDAEIARSLGWGCVLEDPEAHHQWYCWRKDYRCGEWILLPHYTASIDAALSLVPENHTVDLTIGSHWLHRGSDPHFCSNAATPALALCAAALRARLA